MNADAEGDDGEAKIEASHYQFRDAEDVAGLEGLGFWWFPSLHVVFSRAWLRWRRGLFHTRLQNNGQLLLVGISF